MDIPGAVPVPVSVTLAGVALLVTVKVAPSAAAVVGVNRMPMTTLAPGAMVIGYVGVLARLKSPALAPEKARFEITRLADPGLLRVRFCAALVVPFS